MQFVNEGLAAFVLVTVALIVLIILRPSLTTARVGKILAFLAFFVLPVLITLMGTSSHLEHSKSTSFCLSCHVMEPYGASLRIDSEAYLPARHFQNNLIPRDQACFTCHTTYAMFGDFQAKMRGMRHVYVQYLGTVPETLGLYSPFHNRECLHCHAGARSFEENENHVDLREELENNEFSCLDCHDSVHGVEHLSELDLWSGGAE